jgi:hypothetical protein|tara:strand:- start:382 stop:606 length:225 start_codon:yes stop_codon:yes gene_type:complete
MLQIAAAIATTIEFRVITMATATAIDQNNLYFTPQTETEKEEKEQMHHNKRATVLAEKTTQAMTLVDWIIKIFE